MNNWFNKLIKNEQATAEDVSGSAARAGTKKAQALGLGLQCTPPVGQKKTPQPPTVLQKFTPLKQLSADTLNQLAHKTLRYSPGSVVFLQGHLADGVYYLLNGTIELHPDTDEHFDLSVAAKAQPLASYEVTANTPQACLPLNSGKLFGATAIAKTTVDIITLTQELTPLWQKYSNEQLNVLESFDIELPVALNQNEFFINFVQAYHKNSLQLPSLPTVALKLRNAMLEDISIREAVNIIQIDPAIVIKLIQAANSPVYVAVNPAKNCHEAVTRLGLNATRNLVMSINLKQLFHCKSRQIMNHMQNTWKQSLQVSSLCFVLAEELGGVNPEEALLAGLINDIGIIPLLHFAEQHAGEYPDFEQVLAAIPHLRAPVGRMLLNNLGFSPELADIPYTAENWFYDSGEQVQLIDIVILGKLHSYLGTEKAKDLPYINSIPAYSKLKNGKLNPDFSLAILHKAQKRIQATMSILA